MKKLALILIILALPAFVRAADNDRSRLEPISAEDLEWTVPEARGLLLEVSGDSLCFEEYWLHLLPAGAAVSDRTDRTIELDRLPAPCVVDITYGGKAGRHYALRLRVVSEQLPKNVNGDIVVPEHIYR